VRLEVHTSEETVEIFIEADFETHAEEQRRFAILNVPRHLFSEATGEAARRAAKKKDADVLTLGTKWIGTGTGVSGAIVIALDLGIVVHGFALFLLSSFLLGSVALKTQTKPSGRERPNQ
jgi:hypothetical protein